MRPRQVNLLRSARAGAAAAIAARAAVSQLEPDSSQRRSAAYSEVHGGFAGACLWSFKPAGRAPLRAQFPETRTARSLYNKRLQLAARSFRLAAAFAGGRPRFARFRAASPRAAGRCMVAARRAVS